MTIKFKINQNEHQAKIRLFNLLKTLKLIKAYQEQAIQIVNYKHLKINKKQNLLNLLEIGLLNRI